MTSLTDRLREGAAMKCQMENCAFYSEIGDRMPVCRGENPDDIHISAELECPTPEDYEPASWYADV